MDEIKVLERQIIKHKNLYYQGKPEISDFEYDGLEEKLKKIDPGNSSLLIVGSSIFKDEKIEHTHKMLSLNKTYKIDDLIKWQDNRVLLSTFKIDGSSCSIVYKNGKLVMAKTRGDGRYGENITKKILFLLHIPREITIKETVEVRGEVYCTEENLVRLSSVMEELGLEKPTSQRNIVAGLLGRKENIELCEYLNFQAFELISEQEVLKTEEEKFHFLQKLGFETPDFYLNNNEKDIGLRLGEAREFMSQGNYLIDGLVFSYNDLSLHNALGETAHHPRYKMAFKFQGETKQTDIESISWQVSRNGILTPVANVTPVEISGAVISRVTLHNFGVVKQFDLKVGDKIEIVRSGEVIPKFLAVLQSSENDFYYPKECPGCGEEVRVMNIRLICENNLCPDKLKDEILNFIQKIGIDDLSSKRLEEMIRLKLITDIPSLYELKEEDLLTVEKVKEKLSQKILKSIMKSKEVDLITFLSALGISGGAYNKCEKIVLAGFNSIEKIMKMEQADLEQVESFAEKSATDFIQSLQSKKENIEKLISYGFVLKADIASFVQSEITGQKFCITGTLSMKRNELQKIVKKNGGIVQSGVSKETNYLLTNDVESGSSKFKKAKELNISIINEEAFFTLVGEKWQS